MSWTELNSGQLILAVIFVDVAGDGFDLAIIVVAQDSEVGVSDLTQKFPDEGLLCVS